ncbi:MAG: hypothetical protein QNJ97_04010 [Myxococcota bacterium]|nr:hypothetical protein [Myxococcota bacterium]
MRKGTFIIAYICFFAIFIAPSYAVATDFEFQELGAWGATRFSAVDTDTNYIYVGAGRGFIVFDTHMESAPQEALHLVKLGEIILPELVSDMHVSGQYAYVATGAGVSVVEISDPYSPLEIGFQPTPYDCYGIDVDGALAYAAVDSFGLYIYNITDPTNPVEIGHWNGDAHDVDVQDQIAYVTTFAWQGPMKGLHVIDVADPTSPVELGSNADAGDLLDISVKGDHAYAMQGGFSNSGLRVFDISDPTNPVLVGAFNETYQSFAVEIVGNLAYCTGYYQFHILDITDPTNPVALSSRVTVDFPRDIAVRGDEAYVCEGMEGMEMFDVFDPRNPIPTGTQGTYGNMDKVVEKDGYAYVAAGYSGMRVIDVMSPMNPVEVGAYESSGPVHRVHVGGDLAYVSTLYGEEISILNISDPTSPSHTGSIYLPGGYTEGVFTVDHLAYVADGNLGLVIADVSNPSAPVIIGSFDTPGYTSNVYVDGMYAYLADGDNGLYILDISEPIAPTVIGHYDTPGSARQVAVADNTVYIADSTMGVRVIDVTDPSLPFETDAYDDEGFALDLFIRDTYLYLANRYAPLNDTDLIAFDISDPLALRLAAHTSTPGTAQGVYVDEMNTIYLADSEGGLSILSGPPSPIICEGTYWITTGNDLEQVIGCIVITGDLVLNSPQMTSLAGLESLKRIEGSLIIRNNFNLVHLHGLQSLKEIGGDFRIYNDMALLDLQGIGALERIGGTLSIYNALALRTLHAFLDITTIGKTIEIVYCPSLESLFGISNMQVLGEPGNDGKLIIFLATSLPRCDVDALEDQLRSAGWTGPSIVFIICENCPCGD